MRMSFCNQVQAKLRSQLYENNFVTAESMDEEGRYLIDLRLPRAELETIASSGNYSTRGAGPACGRP
jgi:hypothetical protein